jgi:hypothetical protein
VKEDKRNVFIKSAAVWIVAQVRGWMVALESNLESNLELNSVTWLS